MSTGSINICNCESKGSRCLGLWLASGPAVKECLTTADDYSLLHELCPNPGGQLKLKPGTTLCLPSIPRYKPPPPLRRISCFCIHKSLQSIKKKIWIFLLTRQQTLMEVLKVRLTVVGFDQLCAQMAQASCCSLLLVKGFTISIEF